MQNTISEHATVNHALAILVPQVQRVLGAHLVGIYVVGSLALGDFDAASSDIDLIVVTDAPLDARHVAALRAMHARIAESKSPWATQLEMVYVDRAAVRAAAAHGNHRHYPQVEKELGFFLAPLEDGWLVQCYTLREHGIRLFGPAPHTLLDPVDAVALRRTVAPIAEMWLCAAHTDSSWLVWLRVRQHQAFVVLTLCRLLYTLATGRVASKPAAARWAQATLEAAWQGLIQRALAGQHSQSITLELDVRMTVALVELTVAKARHLP